MKHKMRRLRVNTIYALCRWLERNHPLWYRQRLSWLLYTYFYTYGVGFYWKGSEVIWQWPWKRRYYNADRFMCVDCGGAFATLKEIDQFWVEYEDACRDKWSDVGGYE
jgi:hypothetical protein